MKKSLFNITRKVIGTYSLVLLTFLLLPVLLFTNDIEIFQSLIEFINKEN